MKNDLENTTDGFNRAIEIMMKALEVIYNNIFLNKDIT